MRSTNDSTGISRRHFLHATAAVLGSVAVASCGQSGGGGQASAPASAAASEQVSAAASAAASEQTGSALAGATLTWSSPGNPGETQRLQAFTDDFNARTGANAVYQSVPTAEYEAKMLTQLSGGTAPDVFYAFDPSIAKLIASNTIVDLTERLQGPASTSKPEEFFEGLWGPARTADGKIWGAVVDCNPLVFWYNKQLLRDAGVTTMPVELYKQNKWTWDELSKMVEAVAATGKRGVMFENWWGPIWGWATTNGGTVFDGNTFVAVDDAKTKDGIKFILDHLQAKTFTYSGSLPKGQGQDAMFVSGQAAFVVAGRWLLPVFKKSMGLEYDVVAWPTNTGNQVEPVPVAVAWLVQNAKAANPDAAFAFLTDNVSKDGQIFRLKGGGNAVPSIKGADEVVAEGNDPANWQAFLDGRAVGYAIWPGLANYAGLGDDINKTLDDVWLNGGDVDATLQQIAGLVKAKQGA